MNEDVDVIKNCIESSEGILHKRCEQLRELIFMDEDYNPSDVIQLINDIKLVADIIIVQCNKLKNRD